jgi:hypothetical protein
MVVPGFTLNSKGVTGSATGVNKKYAIQVPPGSVNSDSKTKARLNSFALQ